MQFNSYSYILLLGLAAVLFWWLPVRLRRGYVAVLSVLFYASWNAAYVVVPLGLSLVAYYCAGRILLAPPENRGGWLRGGAAIVLLTLLIFKYQQFFFENLNFLLAAARQSPVRASLALALPLGISFYSFEAVSYLIDTRQGRIKQRSFSDVYLFLMFWPHLMAGPLVRYRELVPQLQFNRKFEMPMLVRGLDRLIWGLLQKNLLANTLGAFVDEGFLPKTAHLNSMLDNWFLALAFGLQIYFDFAAYSNMAIGSAQLIGVTLPENFRFPYHAKNPSDFWSRWHMTLSRWIRDYLFFPVNAKFRGAPGPLYASLIAIMALVGLWHGAGWGFILWGAIHGVYLVLYRMWERLSENPRWTRVTQSRPAQALVQAATIAAVMLAWIPFRASSLGQTLTMLRTALTGFSFRTAYSINFHLITLLMAAVVLVEPWLAAAFTRVEKRLSGFTLGPAGLPWVSYYLFRPAVYALGLLLFLAFDDRDTKFIYFQF
jgi:D-alanyl-lipoteichoic acid acyltransferase DltB (MBOAT superfamily)